MNAKRNYIGLACTFHDPAVAIVDAAGEVVFAEATERHLQKKRAEGCPADDMVFLQGLIQEHCEEDTDLVLVRTWTDRSLGSVRWFRMGLGLLELRHRARRASKGERPAGARELAFARRPSITLARYALDAHAHVLPLTSGGVVHGVQWDALHAYVARHRNGASNGHAGHARAAALPIEEAVPRRRVFRAGLDHHLTHAATACFTSPFDEAVCAVVDGHAERGSTSFFRYAEGRIEPIERRQRSWVSLGILYSMVCAACGFDPVRGEEWKVMGLAPYGRVDPEIAAVLEPLLRVDDLRFVGGADADLYGPVFGRLATFPREDLARTAQDFFQRRMEELLGNLARRGLSTNLVLGGGCALNSSANGRYVENTPFERLHVYAAPGDDGNALGAALWAWHQDHPGERRARGEAMTPYLGSRASPETLDNVLALGRPAGHRSWPGRVHERAAALLAEGKIVGWMQGRAEFGPRALGNRSILADPRRADVKEALNARVKFREEFRPFAPSILHEHGDEYFEDYQETPYMERTLRFREEVKGKVPGVVHVDGTGRLQTVRREWNERYHALISEFHRLTGVPIVLNTSFNVMGKPIVHTIEDALAVFYTSGLDALVIDDEVFEKG